MSNLQFKTFTVTEFNKIFLDLQPGQLPDDSVCFKCWFNYHSTAWHGC